MSNDRKPETPDSDMDIEVCHGYQIAGNYWMAIAININVPNDAHTFVNQTMEEDGIEQGAFTSAIGWAYPGPELKATAAEADAIENDIRMKAAAYDEATVRQNAGTPDYLQDEAIAADHDVRIKAAAYDAAKAETAAIRVRQAADRQARVNTQYDIDAFDEAEATKIRASHEERAIVKASAGETLTPWEKDIVLRVAERDLGYGIMTPEFLAKYNL